MMQKILMLILLVFIISCKENKESTTIQSLSYKEISEVELINELTPFQIIQLASSVQVVDSLFTARDTTVKIFSEQIKFNWKEPSVTVNFSKLNLNNVNRSLEKLFSLLNSKEPCIQILNLNASRCQMKRSTIGLEALFLIANIRGDGFPCSSPILEKAEEHYKKEYLKWWETTAGTRSAE
ncbi:MAG: hypothetical protein AB8H03_26140 [Saprospiraceae bacterium]